jgi:hypothetical protein
MRCSRPPRRESCEPPVRNYTNSLSGGNTTMNAIGDFAKSIWKAFPDGSLELISIGDTGGGLVAIQWILHGTHTGPLMDVRVWRHVLVPLIVLELELELVLGFRFRYCRRAAGMTRSQTGINPRITEPRTRTSSSSRTIRGRGHDAKHVPGLAWVNIKRRLPCRGQRDALVYRGQRHT